MTKNILGISAGTKYFGYAVIRNRELVDWRVKSFPGRWSNLKLRMILRTFEKMLSQNIDCVALKLNDPLKMSKSLNAINARLTKIAAQKNIPVVSCSTKEICKHFGVKNKHHLIKCYSEDFPQLFKDAAKSEDRNHMKLFEAIGAAELVSKWW